MGWHILISISVVLYSFSVLLQRVILKESKSNPIAFAILFQLLVGILIGVVGLIFTDFQIPNLKSLFPAIFLMIIMYAVMNVLIYSSLKLIEASVFTIIISSRVFFTVFASSIFLKEFLSAPQFVGTIMVFLGIVFVSLTTKKAKLNRGELLAIIGAVVFGFVNTVDRYLVQHINVYPYTTIAFIAPALLLSMVCSKETKKIKHFLKKKTIMRMGLVVVLYGFSAVFFYSALQVGNNSSQIVSINLSSVILIVVLSIVFLNERNNIVKKFVGAIVSFIGLLLLTT